jgi:adenylate cyclase
MSNLTDSFEKVIFATDAVGFSKLVSNNEYETLASLKECLRIISTTLTSFEGRIFHSAGDSVLAEFDSSDNALSAALATQERLCTYNSDTNLQKIEFRIGLDIGEVFSDGDNLLGEAVNFASRLESFAQPKGISISNRFYQSLNSSEIQTNDHGLQTVKNSKIHCRDIVLPNLKKRRILSNKQKLNITMFGTLITFLCIFLFYQNYFVTEYERSQVAVMPLINNTGDPSLDYIASGLRGEISGAISQIGSMAVTSDASLNFVETEENTTGQVAKNLGLDHLLLGQLNREQDKISLKLNLFETKINSQKTIYSITGSIDEILESREAIIKSIIRAIDVPVSKVDETNATRFGTVNLRAYEEFLKGDFNFKLRSPEGALAAKGHFEKALKLDPSFARPYGYLALTFSRGANANSRLALPNISRETAVYMADILSLAGISIGPNIPQAYFSRAFIETFLLREHRAALENVNLALSLNPSYADALGLKASILNKLQKPEEALKALAKAKKLNPNFSVEYLQIEAIALLMLGQWEAAKTTSSIAVERLPESASGLINLICADFYLGNIDDALWNLEEFIIINPDFDLSRATLNENKLWRKLTIECFQKLENSLNN